MSHSTDDSRPAVPAAAGKPTLEMLLRLKRAERPDAAFWEEFERGLRQKQLAAIIEPKPWWLGLALFGRRLTPLGLPVSAAAAALFAVMVVRTQSPFVSSSAPVRFGAGQTAHAEIAANPAPARVAAAVSAALVAESSPASPAAPENLRVEENRPPAARPEPALVAMSGSGSAPTSDAEIPVVASLLELTPAHAAAPTPSEATIAQNLAAVRAEAPELLPDATRLEPTNRASESAEASSAIDPDALKMEVHNPRHARVLLAMAENSSVEAIGGMAHVRDRTVRSLNNDDAFSGSSSRLGVGGDRLSLSF